MPAAIEKAIKDQSTIAGGVKIARLNNASSLPIHLHLKILNTRKKEYINPLSCIKYKDTFKPKIFELEVLNSEKKIKKKLYDNNYQVKFYAVDKILDFKYPRSVYEVKYKIEYFDDNLRIKNSAYKTLFNANFIPCGYECIPENLWAQGGFIKKDETPFYHNFFDTPPIPKGAFVYRLTDDRKLNTNYFHSLGSTFNPCTNNQAKKADSIKISIQVYDQKMNSSEKSFSYKLDCR